VLSTATTALAVSLEKNTFLSKFTVKSVVPSGPQQQQLAMQLPPQQLVNLAECFNV
jgi:hypothetical protein